MANCQLRAANNVVLTASHMRVRNRVLSHGRYALPQVWVGLNLAPALFDAEAGTGGRRRTARLRLDLADDCGPQLASLVLPENPPA